MKISQKQASLLAGEVLRQLKNSRSNKISDEKKAELKLFFDERKKFVTNVDDAKAALQKHDNTLRPITGNIRSGGYHGITSVIEDMEKCKTPSVSEIEDKIILESMFASEDDMEKFVATIVKKFTKRKTVPENN